MLPRVTAIDSSRQTGSLMKARHDAGERTGGATLEVALTIQPVTTMKSKQFHLVGRNTNREVAGEDLKVICGSLFSCL